jgi:hypothetical protein
VNQKYVSSGPTLIVHKLILANEPRLQRHFNALRQHHRNGVFLFYPKRFTQNFALRSRILNFNFEILPNNRVVACSELRLPSPLLLLLGSARRFKCPRSNGTVLPAPRRSRGRPGARLHGVCLKRGGGRDGRLRGHRHGCLHGKCKFGSHVAVAGVVAIRDEGTSTVVSALDSTTLFSSRRRSSWRLKRRSRFERCPRREDRNRGLGPRFRHEVHGISPRSDS